MEKINKPNKGISPKWNVLLYNRFAYDNKKVYNVLSNISFCEDIIKKLSKLEYTSEFKTELDKICICHFWAKVEYECEVSDYPAYIDKEEAIRIANDLNDNKILYRTPVNLESSFKVDVYYQLNLNFDAFSEYVYNNLKLIKKYTTQKMISKTLFD